jgi:methyltransferase (TIGR00027 family)
MEISENAEEEFSKMNKIFKEIAGPGSKTAMGVLLARFFESQKPEDERICYDPYAGYFINPEILEWGAHHPDEARMMQEQLDRFFPGRNNSIVARVRFFDDFVKKSIDEGIEQLVILGAGYDSRAYRIEGLKKIKTFEVDHPATQNIKINKIKMIFGSSPSHVVYVPCNLETEDFGQRLIDMGYNQHVKTLFLMEGVLMYLQPKVVDDILSVVVKNSGKNSSILFDYFPQSAVDGSSKLEVGRNIRNQVSQLGEPFKFGINEGTVETFLTQRGFTQVCNVTIEDCKKAYFQGKNKNRTVDSLKSFVYAVVQ